MTDADPSAASVSFITTEHFTLQGERAQTVSEATGRASMFLASVSGGLVALSLMAAAAKIDTAFYALALTVLPTLAFVGLVTFERVLQNRLEDLIDANRIARLRGFYFDHAPELDAYLLSVPPERRLIVQGLPEGPWQHFVTIAGMISVITSALAGASAAVLVAVVSDHSLVSALAAGGVVAVAALSAMMRYQNVAWTRLRTRVQQASELHARDGGFAGGDPTTEERRLGLDVAGPAGRRGPPEEAYERQALAFPTE